MGSSSRFQRLDIDFDVPEEPSISARSAVLVAVGVCFLSGTLGYAGWLLTRAQPDLPSITTTTTTVAHPVPAAASHPARSPATRAVTPHAPPAPASPPAVTPAAPIGRALLDPSSTLYRDGAPPASAPAAVPAAVPAEAPVAAAQPVEPAADADGQTSALPMASPTMPAPPAALVPVMPAPPANAVPMPHPPVASVAVAPPDMVPTPRPRPASLKPRKPIPAPEPSPIVMPATEIFWE